MLLIAIKTGSGRRALHTRRNPPLTGQFLPEGDNMGSRPWVDFFNLVQATIACRMPKSKNSTKWRIGLKGSNKIFGERHVVFVCRVTKKNNHGTLNAEKGTFM